MSPVEFKIGPSRTMPGTLAQRVVPAGVRIPNPFGVQHRWRQPAGRSSGGAFALTDLEGMEWSYGTSDQHNYRELLSVYNPVLPWVWIYMLDPRSEEGIWVEAVMQEPSVVRGVGRTIQSMTIMFSGVSRV
jgi:hypothetical protein